MPDLFQTDAPPQVTITVRLQRWEADAFAEFLKRSKWDDYRHNAVNGDEAHNMVAACEKLRAAFAEAGFAPR